MSRQDAEPSIDAQVEKALDVAESESMGCVPATPSQATRMSELAKTGELVRLVPGIYVRRRVDDAWCDDPRKRAFWIARAYAKAHPDKTLCSFSAAVVQGLWVSYNLLYALYVVATPGETTHRSPYVFYRRLKDFETAKSAGVMVTCVEQTVLDCALAASFAEGLAIADSALRYYDLTNEDLVAYFSKHGKRRPGILRARMVARYADARAENGGESIVRGMIIAVGYMPPTMLQAEFVDPVETDKTLRVDGFFALGGNRGVILEVDGMSKYPSLADTLGRHEESAGKHSFSKAVSGQKPDGDLKSALIAERQRESHITALGYPVMRVLFMRVREPGYLVSLLRAYGIPQVQDPFPFR